MFILMKLTSLMSMKMTTPVLMISDDHYDDCDGDEGDDDDDDDDDDVFRLHIVYVGLIFTCSYIDRS